MELPAFFRSAEDNEEEGNLGPVLRQAQEEDGGNAGGGWECEKMVRQYHCETTVMNGCEVGFKSGMGGSRNPEARHVANNQPTQSGQRPLRSCLRQGSCSGNFLERDVPPGFTQQYDPSIGHGYLPPQQLSAKPYGQSYGQAYCPNYGMCPGTGTLGHRWPFQPFDPHSLGTFHGQEQPLSDVTQSNFKPDVNNSYFPGGSVEQCPVQEQVQLGPVHPQPNDCYCGRQESQRHHHFNRRSAPQKYRRPENQPETLSCHPPMPFQNHERQKCRISFQNCGPPCCGCDPSRIQNCMDSDDSYLFKGSLRGGTTQTERPSRFAAAVQTMLQSTDRSFQTDGMPGRDCECQTVEPLYSSEFAQTSVVSRQIKLTQTMSAPEETSMKTQTRNPNDFKQSTQILGSQRGPPGKTSRGSKNPPMESSLAIPRGGSAENYSTSNQVTRNQSSRKRSVPFRTSLDPQGAQRLSALNKPNVDVKRSGQEHKHGSLRPNLEGSLPRTQSTPDVLEGADNEDTLQRPASIVMIPGAHTSPHNVPERFNEIPAPSQMPDRQDPRNSSFMPAFGKLKRPYQLQSSTCPSILIKLTPDACVPKAGAGCKSCCERIQIWEQFPKPVYPQSQMLTIPNFADFPNGIPYNTNGTQQRFPSMSNSDKNSRTKNPGFPRSTAGGTYPGKSTLEQVEQNNLRELQADLLETRRKDHPDAKYNHTNTHESESIQSVEASTSKPTQLHQLKAGPNQIVGLDSGPAAMERPSPWQFQARNPQFYSRYPSYPTNSYQGAPAGCNFTPLQRKIPPCLECSGSPCCSFDCVQEMPGGRFLVYEEIPMDSNDESLTKQCCYGNMDSYVLEDQIQENTEDIICMKREPSCYPVKFENDRFKTDQREAKQASFASTQRMGIKCGKKFRGRICQCRGLGPRRKPVKYVVEEEDEE